MKKLLLTYIVISGFGMLYLLLEVNRLKQPQVLRTTGIVVIDSAGRDRILIGAPFPYSDDRVRTDTSAVRQLWASRFQDLPYMEWYSKYHHSGNGVLILNEAGFDKVLLGDNLTDPNTGQRNGRPTGLLWNDDLGFERGGLGLNRLKESGLYRNVIGLDDETGEALHLGILEDGTRMLRMAWSDTTLLIGRGVPGNFLFESVRPFAGIKFQSSRNPAGLQINWIEKQQ